MKSMKSARRALRASTGRLRPSDRDDRRFVDNAYQRLLGRDPDREGRRSQLRFLRGGGPRAEVLRQIAVSEEYVNLVAARVDRGPGISDQEWLAAAYRDALGRDPDPEGLRFYQSRLDAGSSRRDLAKTLVRSDEHVNRVTAELYDLPNLRERWPDRYVQARSRNDGHVLAFRAETPEWFDRLEDAILSSNYYEKPGIWEFSLNRDKRLMAEIVASLEPAEVLEIGCSNGTVLQALHERGVRVTGLDISPSAVALADESIRDRIRIGDLLTATLPTNYDVIYGLDVFEHLNPNRLGVYLERVRALTNPGGFVFTNLPAFGEDPEFGTVFPLDLVDWDAEAARGELFSLLPVDQDGYPYHGHLVWADSGWWVRQWEAAGLRREPAIERALHRRYDEYMRRSSPARRSFYVFSRDADPTRVDGLAERIGRTGSAILDKEWDPAAEHG
jgi:2-polyprenyl-3-methyl-5-hydroxy-6-metoxy-1,4-benzoquinol methylase